jgi:hypothetical protein
MRNLAGGGGVIDQAPRYSRHRTGAWPYQRDSPTTNGRDLIRSPCGHAGRHIAVGRGSVRCRGIARCLIYDVAPSCRIARRTALEVRRR